MRHLTEEVSTSTYDSYQGFTMTKRIHMKSSKGNTTISLGTGYVLIRVYVCVCVRVYVLNCSVMSNSALAGKFFT